MAQAQGIFDAKLRELEREREKFQGQMEMLQGEEGKSLYKAVQELTQECRQQDRCLRRMAETCSSPAVAALTDAQLTYNKQTEELLERLCAHQDPCGDGKAAETMELYAESAIELAIQAERYAQLAACSAAELLAERQEDREE